MEYLTTTNLATQMNIRANELYSKLQSLEWVERKTEKWFLTEKGREAGGQIRTDPKFGEYIVWPENIVIEESQVKEKTTLLDIATIGRHFNVSSQRLNLIISELGWIEKNAESWVITKLGKKVGGNKYEHETSGESYILWPDAILENKTLIEVFNDRTTKETGEHGVKRVHRKSSASELTPKSEALHRTLDGHYVRSASEVIIDDILYQYGLLHAYERKIIVGEEELISDFYLPTGKVYIEYWEKETDSKSSESKLAKIEFYRKNDIPVIELHEADILNLDEHLPRKLLKYGIRVY